MKFITCPPAFCDYGPRMKRFQKDEEQRRRLGNTNDGEINRIKILRKEEKLETVLLRSSTLPPPLPRSHSSSSSLVLLPEHLTPQPSVKECVCVCERV